MYKQARFIFKFKNIFLEVDSFQQPLITLHSRLLSSQLIIHISIINLAIPSSQLINHKGIMNMAILLAQLISHKNLISIEILSSQLISHKSIINIVLVPLRVLLQHVPYSLSFCFVPPKQLSDQMFGFLGQISHNIFIAKPFIEVYYPPTFRT